MPAYNEVRYIGRCIGEARAYMEDRGLTYEIIVSADGDDGTRELASQLAQSDPRLRVIGTEKRRGKGYGVRQGVALADGEIIGFLDADNKTPIGEFNKIEPWLSRGYQIVIGSRGLQESRIERPQPLYRRLGARAFGVFMHSVVGLSDIVDTQCGFKFFQRDVALDLFRRQKINGYMFDVEILYLAKKAGYRIMQVPIHWSDDGDSRLDLLSGNIRNVVDILNIRVANSRKLSVFSGADKPDFSADRKRVNK